MTTLHTASSALVETINALAANSPALRCLNLDEIRSALEADQTTVLLSTLADTTGKLEFIIDTGCENLSIHDWKQIRQSVKVSKMLLKSINA